MPLSAASSSENEVDYSVLLIRSSLPELVRETLFLSVHRLCLHLHAEATALAEAIVEGELVHDGRGAAGTLGC